ncbi:hypothetical protein B9G69_011260 [Bdellovibrio sp. SKB1291214]|uniref:hypothetical protein n=1 Tax=Bdellovibrio sp. SKB1291214 TaxID=1732569 RepID=UPI000B51CF78|nr:hypothetical protein [Bdellovibrio sp. SKB1291214]UYL07624.1 hypothetical protein B9G69_011260 [Bdellovibrio sp. SKB1291214]
MSKILLVYEDYADLMSVESTLKKVGFDVIGLSSEYAVSDQIISFNPDVVIGAGKGAKVSSLGVGKRLKEMSRWSGKSVLIFPAGFKPSPQDLIKLRVDMILEAPVAPLRIVQVLAKLLGQDEGALLEKLNKAIHLESPGAKPVSPAAAQGKFNTENEAIFVKGSSSDESEEGPAGVGFNLDNEPPGEGAEFNLSTEREVETPRFKIGAKFQTADVEPETEKADEVAFPDVDLKALERELLGGGAPEVEKVENVPAPAPAEVKEQAPSKARQELQKATAKLAERMKKYTDLVSDVKVAPNSTITRVESRKRQLDIASQWDRESINDLDKLRQEFTKAMFKK